MSFTIGKKTEISGYVSQLDHGIRAVEHTLPHLAELALGGTAVGTGINTPKGFPQMVIKMLAKETRLPITESRDHFEAQGARDGLVEASGALRVLAVSLTKINNDLRWMGSGPNAGLAELHIPDLQPGSSIMPGKVNPTQCEAIVMIGIQVFGNDTAVSFAGSQGNFELNAMRPVIIKNFLHSARILADGCEKFEQYSVQGTQLNLKKIQSYVDNSVMLVTALSPIIGYQNSAKIAEDAMAKDISLKEAALSSGLVTEKQFNDAVVPADMVGSGFGGA